MSDEPKEIEWSLEQLEKLEDDLPKIRIASSVAGAVRTRDHKIKKGDIKPKTIHVVDRNDPSWTSIKSIPDNEFTKKVLERAGVEFSVNEGEKQLEAICANCEKPFIKPSGFRSSTTRCMMCRNPTCSHHGCEAKLSSCTFTPSVVEARGGMSPMCQRHRYEAQAASGRSPNPLKDLSGIDFGCLRVIARDTNKKVRDAYWICMCSCGIEKSIHGRNLTSGDTKSCGIRKNHPKIKEDK